MSYGESLVRRYLVAFSPHPFIVNYRPKWLFGLELDFFYPSKNIAIEFQGDHHYMPTEYSHDLKSVQRRDGIKRRLCKRNGVTLIKLDACDLWWRRLRHKLKPLHFHKKCPSKIIPMLDAESSKYRKLLKNNFNSVSALRRNHPKRKL